MTKKLEPQITQITQTPREGGLYVAQTVCVGIHSSGGEGVCVIMRGCNLNEPGKHDRKKMFKNICKQIRL